ncbi:MAG: hypothetical protein JW849_01225, partial [Phycisphaerae bacterium]|nr:hypothetical protein [Phycisphaerae bacterium]
ERFLLPICAGVLMIWFSPKRVNDPARKTAFANGQFLLFRRDAFQAVGGYEALKDSIIEDMDLARRMKAAGRRIVVAPSRGLMSVRMYTSLRELRGGWIRIFLGCFPSVFRLLAAAGVLLGRGLTLTILAAVGWAMYAAGAGEGWLICAIVASAGLAAQLVMTARFYRYAGTRWALGLLYPVGCGLVAGLLFLALLCRLTGGNVVWKGTRYTAAKSSSNIY